MRLAAEGTAGPGAGQTRSPQVVAVRGARSGARGAGVVTALTHVGGHLMKAFDFAVQTVVSSLDHIQTGGCSMVRPGLVYYRGRQMSLRVRSWHCASTTSPHGPDNSIFAYSQPSTAIFYQRHGYWDVFQFLPIYLGFHPGVPQIAILPQRDSGLSAGAALRFDSAEWWCQGTQPGAPTKTPVGEWCCLSLFTSSATSFWRRRLALLKEPVCFTPTEKRKGKSGL